MLRKEICAEIKAVAGKERTLEFIGSTESVDRVGDVIEAAGWQLKNFKTNPVFLWAHKYDQPPIGKATRVWKSEGKLKFHIEFADAETYEFADTIFKLYKGGFLNAVSVGFEPQEWEDLDTKDDSRGRRYKKQDLLELSGVPVPANAEALMSAREQGVITVKELESVTKPEETDDYIRIPVASCDITATITISANEGIKALYCGKDKKIATYLFAKDHGWTMAKAKKWVADHKKAKYIIPTWDYKAVETELDSITIPSFDYPNVDIDGNGGITALMPDTTDTLIFPNKDNTIPLNPEDSLEWNQKLDQESLKDEIDFLRTWVHLTGMEEEAKGLAWELVREIMTYTGDDIPDDITAKIGAVLSKKNRSDLDEAKRRIDDVLASEEKPRPEDKPKSIWARAGLTT